MQLEYKQRRSNSAGAGTDFELRLQPQLDTLRPLGRGSSHAPNLVHCSPLIVHACTATGSSVSLQSY